MASHGWMFEIDDPMIEATEPSRPSRTEVLWRRHADELLQFATMLVGPNDAPDTVMLGEHYDLVLPVLEGLSLTDVALTDAITSDLPISMYHYGFELVMGAACVFEDRRSAFAPDDTATPAELATQIRAVANAAIAAGHARAVEYLLTPLLDIVERRNPEVELSDWIDCPTWATTK